MSFGGTQFKAGDIRNILNSNNEDKEKLLQFLQFWSVVDVKLRQADLDVVLNYREELKDSTGSYLPKYSLYISIKDSDKITLKWDSTSCNLKLDCEIYDLSPEMKKRLDLFYDIVESYQTFKEEMA